MGSGLRWICLVFAKLVHSRYTTEVASRVAPGFKWLMKTENLFTNGRWFKVDLFSIRQACPLSLHH